MVRNIVSSHWKSAARNYGFACLTDRDDWYTLANEFRDVGSVAGNRLGRSSKIVYVAHADPSKVHDILMTAGIISRLVVS